MNHIDARYLGHFKDRRVLVVEDEYFLADETRRTLENLGALVVGPVTHVEDALRLLASGEIDAAILDVHLDGEFVFPVAEKLEQNGIPYIFATSYDPSIVPERFTGFVLSTRPIDLDKIANALFGSPKADH